jgi:hypothetical protein|tara:strand:- start:2793 stop:3140 length:348 start_codon:yes stop_codon:yes gene_type:complete
MQIQISGGISNSSLQIGDDIYFVPNSSLANINNQSSSSNSPVLVGKVSNITSGGYIEIDNPLNSPANGDFIMFSKNKAVNNTSLIGYFAEVKLRNNSKEKAELFALSSETAESSK